MKLQQIKSFATLPIILGVQSLKLETTLGTDTLRIAYGSAQLLVLVMLAFVYLRLPAAAGGDGDATIKVPEKKQFGQVVKPAEELTVREYDMSQLKEKVREVVMGSLVLGFIHYKWETTLPLIIQTALAPINILTSPLVIVHIFGYEATGQFARPWIEDSPFAPAPSGDDKDKDKDQDQDQDKKKDQTSKQSEPAAGEKAKAAAGTAGKRVSNKQAIELATELKARGLDSLASESVGQLKAHLGTLGARAVLIASCAEKRDMVELLRDTIDALVGDDDDDAADQSESAKKDQ